MATVIFTAVGAALGGPVGAVIGAAVGSQVDAAIFKGSDRQGRRLQDLTVSTSVYGAALPRHFGQMRVGGSIIWSTDMVEHATTSGSGKGKPSITNYSYTVSFAVALASRPILGLGRIWADGKLLRGAAGDLKVGGSLRIHTGHGDQLADPLIVAQKGAATCPAHRGLAYVVFEDLQLAEFGNRIPGLSFEIFCDEGALSIADLFEELIDDVDASVPLAGVRGYTAAEALADTLAQFQPVMPMLYNAGGDSLLVTSEGLEAPVVALPEPAISGAREDFGGKAGFSRCRSPAAEAPPHVLRYYDIGLDYQPGSQRAIGKAVIGHPRSVDLPACLSGDDAFRLIVKAARNQGWARDTVAWRCAELDAAVGPGSVVTLDGLGGLWRVDEWEWRSAGVEISLHRISPTADIAMSAASSGQALIAADLPVSPTLITSYELPWNGQGNPDTAAIYAALSSQGDGWKGATVYADSGNGQLVRVGAGSRQRATVGTCQTTLQNSSPCLIDRVSSLLVRLTDPAMGLSSAGASALAQGANKALVGREIIQFGAATALGDGVWCLENLWRGRGGTESRLPDHVVGECFVLLDDVPVAIETSAIGRGEKVRLAAIGLGDSQAVESTILNRGIALRPLTPVHRRADHSPAGDLTLSWIRRARGAWEWSDEVDVPLQEETENYLVGYGPLDSPLRLWHATTNSLSLNSIDVAALQTALPPSDFWVRQIGTHAMSDALHLFHLA